MMAAEGDDKRDKVSQICSFFLSFLKMRQMCQSLDHHSGPPPPPAAAHLILLTVFDLEKILRSIKIDYLSTLLKKCVPAFYFSLGRDLLT